MAFDKPEPDRYKRGDRLPGAGDFNALNDQGVRHISGPGVGNYGKRITLPGTPTIPGVPDTQHFHAKVVVIEEFPDYLLCVPLQFPTAASGWWGPVQYQSTRGETLTLHNSLYVAKPQHLQKTYYDGWTFNFYGAPTTYAYINDNTRSATAAGVTVLEHVNTPYVAGDVITVLRGVTGLMDPTAKPLPILYYDANGEACRRWQRNSQEVGDVIWTHYRSDCVAGIVKRYRQTVALEGGQWTVGSWVFDSYQGCCDCPPAPIEPCCTNPGSGSGTPAPLPATLTIKLYRTFVHDLAHVDNDTITITANLDGASASYTIPTTDAAVTGGTVRIQGSINCDPEFNGGPDSLGPWQIALSVFFHDGSGWVEDFAGLIVIAYQRCNPPCIAGVAMNTEESGLGSPASARSYYAVVVGDCAAESDCTGPFCWETGGGDAIELDYLGNGIWKGPYYVPYLFRDSWGDAHFIWSYRLGFPVTGYQVVKLNGTFDCLGMVLTTPDPFWGSGSVASVGLSPGPCPAASGSGSGSGSGPSGACICPAGNQLCLYTRAGPGNPTGGSSPLADFLSDSVTLNHVIGCVWGAVDHGWTITVDMPADLAHFNDLTVHYDNGNGETALYQFTTPPPSVYNCNVFNDVSLNFVSQTGTAAWPSTIQVATGVCP